MKEYNVKYPENLYLKEAVDKSGLKVKFLAKRVGVSTRVTSQVINGHYKGDNIVPKLRIELGLDN